MEVSIDLLNKYNVPVPRYTSYPTVPYWDETIDQQNWIHAFKKRFVECNQKEGISLYLHLPFCEKMCTFCGCNKKITTNHDVEAEYMEVLLKEWKLYVALMDQKPILKELHIGGGTPTSLGTKHLGYLIEHIQNMYFLNMI